MGIGFVPGGVLDLFWVGQIRGEGKERWVDGLVYFGPAHPSLEPYHFPDLNGPARIGRGVEVLVCVVGAW